MSYEIRLGTLSLDENKEKDIVEVVSALAKKHKLGEFISELVRDAYDNTDCYKNAWDIVNKAGITYCRNRFFLSVSKDVAEMKDKVDAIYDMCTKLMVAYQFRGQLGIENKTENILMAQFLMQQQINSLTSTLGLDDHRVFKSNKVSDFKKEADSILNYILESYGCLVDELKDSLMGDVSKQLGMQMIQTQDQQVNGEEKVAGQKQICSNDSEQADINNDDSEYDDLQSNNENTPDEDVVDFSNADLGKLGSFFGGMLD